MNLKKKFKNNLVFAFLAQGISLVMSLLMSLVVPKLLNVTNFGYWQLFIFYYGYVGFFHFGLNDGVYLKYGGVPYNDLNKKTIGSQFRLSAVLQIIIALLLSVCASLLIHDTDRLFIVCAACVCLVINNTALFLGYVFQASNETKIFSVSVIIDKLIFLLILCMLIFIKQDNFRIYVYLYLFSKFISLLYCVYKGREVVFSDNEELKNTLWEMGSNIKIGISLMLANIASTLIIGCARFIIDRKWGIETFGQFSLSISMINFVLLFLGQVSMVLFPMLRQIEDDKQVHLYVGIKDALTLILPLVFVAYIPAGSVLQMWLPQYKSSITFLGILLPICTYNGKMNLLCNTYYKVLRKERELLSVNIITMLLSLLLSAAAAYLFQNIIAVALSVVIATAFRSYVSEVYIAKLMGCSIWKDILLESIIVTVFILVVNYLSGFFAFALITAVYLLYLGFNMDKLTTLKKMRI